ncbi:MAG: F0F1 ATP synthase subunit A [Fimbriimonadaceae bacterium]
MTLSPASLIAAETGGGHHLPDFAILFYAGVVILTILVLVLIARRGFNDRVFKNPVSQASEQMYLFIEGMAVGVIGPHGRRYVPFLLTLWMFIFVSNILGLMLPHTPTASWSWNVGLALVVFIYVQIEGVRAQGGLGHLRHFAGPKLPIYLAWMALLIFPIEIISELVKIVSLSLRLYGNISGGHVVKQSLDSLAGGWPLGALVMPLEILVAIIQALVFTILTTIYFSLVTHHEEEGHESPGQGAKAHA